MIRPSATYADTSIEDAAAGFPARRLAGIGFVILLHISIIYALVSGLGEQAVQILHQPLVAKILTEAKPPPPAPPPPPPQFVQPPPPYIPPPLIQIAPPPAPPVIAAVTHVKPAAPPPAPVPVPQVKRAAGLDPNQSCASPDYPEEAQSMGETGTSILQFLIGADGRVENSRIAGSSGHTSLDDAAMAALSQCKFQPAIGVDGKPQEAWTSIRYVWSLN